ARVLGGPARRGKSVVGGRRIAMLRREPVLDREDRAARRVRERTAEVVRDRDAPDHPAAAVEVDEEGKDPGRRPVDPRGYRGRAVDDQVAHDRDVLERDHRVDGRASTAYARLGDREL